MPHNYNCQALIDGCWELVPVRRAKQRGTFPVRCPECKGPVRLHAKQKIKAHAEHLSRFSGCTRGDCFNGTRGIHPDAIGLDGPTIDEDLKAIEDDLETALENERSKKVGQGMCITSAQRKQMERHAVKHAISHYAARGYTVKDVGNTKSWDLDCRKDDRVMRVEVKGTQTSGTRVVLTPNEVRNARQHDTALFILHSVRFSTTGKSYKTIGGKKRIIDPWHIDKSGRLKPISYIYDLHKKQQNAKPRGTANESQPLRCHL